MPGKLPKAAFTLENSTITVSLDSDANALTFFNWLHSEYSANLNGPTGDLIDRRGSVIQKSGVVKRGGVSEMVVGGVVKAIVADQGDGWFEVETETEKAFRFDRETLQQIDGDRRFEFDQ